MMEINEHVKLVAGRPSNSRVIHGILTVAYRGNTIDLPYKMTKTRNFLDRDFLSST